MPHGREAASRPVINDVVARERRARSP